MQIGGVRFKGKVEYQACVIAKQDIAKNTFLWELCGVLSSDAGGKSCSTMRAHYAQCQGEHPNDRWLVGPARFCNHSCNNNSILLPVNNRPAMVIQVIRHIRAGQEITVSYGDDFWEDDCLCEICTGSLLTYL